MSSNFTASSIAATDLAAMPSSSYIYSASVPSNNFAYDNNGTASTTLSATTDTGYQSTITLALGAVQPAMTPANPGDAIYSYGIVDNSAFQAWVQQVSAHSNSSVSLTGGAGLPFVNYQTAGTYTMKMQISSSQTGNLDAGTAQIIVAGGGGAGCTSNVCPDQQ